MTMAEPNSAWIKNGTIVVEHFRKDGLVYGHRQRPEQEWCVFGRDFFRVQEEVFEDATSEAEPFDVTTLKTYPGKAAL